jgi:hypothetical protein
VSADDSLVFAARQDRLDEAELLQAACQRLDLRVGDASRVRRVRAEVVDRDFDDGEGEAVGVTLFRFFRFFRKARLAQQEQLSRR